MRAIRKKAEYGASNDIGNRVKEYSAVFTSILRSIAYLFSKNPDYLRMNGRFFFDNEPVFYPLEVEGEKTLEETYELGGKWIVPASELLISKSRKKKRAFLTISFNEINDENSSASLTLYFANSKLYINADIKGEPFSGATAIYTYPPENMASCLFFELNPQAREVVAKYLKKHEAELPGEFVFRADAYRSIEEAIGKIDDVPDAYPNESYLVDFKIFYAFNGRRIEIFRAYFKEKILSPGFPPIGRFLEEPTRIEISFKDQDPETLYEITTDLTTLLTFAKKWGFSKDLEAIRSRMKNIAEYVLRGAFILRALKLAENI